jgi:hypothetical protein
MTMKFYENLDPVERKKMVLRAVAFSSAMEGMSQAKQECIENLAALERWDKESLLEVMRGVDQEAVMDVLGDIEVLDALRHAQKSGESTRPAADFFKEITKKKEC